MCILKGFSRFVWSYDVQNGFVYESFSFDHYIEESNLVLEFDARVEFVSLCCISVVSILAMKILANDTAILVPMAVPCVFR